MGWFKAKYIKIVTFTQPLDKEFNEINFSNWGVTTHLFSKHFKIFQEPSKHCSVSEQTLGKFFPDVRRGIKEIQNNKDRIFFVIVTYCCLFYSLSGRCVRIRCSQNKLHHWPFSYFSKQHLDVAQSDYIHIHF